MNITQKNGKTIINGKEITTIGNNSNVTITNNKVFVNGKEVSDLNLLPEKAIFITIEGNIDTLEIDNCETITCNTAGEITTTNGNVTVNGDVSGDVSTVNGKVKANTITGKVKTVNGNISKF